MRRLPWLDRLLLLTLVPLWLVALSLHVRQVWRGQLAHVGFYVAAAADNEGYPTVSAFWPGEVQSDGRVAIGDRVVSINSRDLAGAGPYTFFARALTELARVRQHDPLATVPVVYQKDGERREAALPFIPVRFPWRTLPLATAFVVTAVLVMLRRPGTRIGRAFFLGAMLFSLHWTWFFGGTMAITYAWYAVFFLSALMLPAMLYAAEIFPEEIAPTRVARWPWLFLVYAPVLLTSAVGGPLPPAFGLSGVYVINVLFIVALLAILTGNYRRATARGRRQLRWGVFGMYVGLAPMLVANVVMLAVPEWWWLLDLSATAEVVIPISILIAIVRFNLYDIDRLITSAIAYSVLSILFVGMMLMVGPRVAEAASRLVGLDRHIGTAAMSVVLALGLVGGQRILNPFVERLFFRERYSLDQGIRALLAELGGVAKIEELFDLVGRRLQSLFRPVSCVVYALAGDSYEPAFASLRHADAQRPTTMSARHPIVAEVARAQAPLDVEAWTNRRVRDPAVVEQSPLRSLNAAVMFPVGDGETSALVVLGGKRSGDVYSPSDMALLSAVGDAVSGTFARLARQRRTAAGPVLLPRRFEMLGEIGRGGMGCVYRVRHTTLGKVRAMKILPEHLASDEMLVARFRREARVMAELRHPHIVQVVDFDQEGSLYYFVMECIEGTSLGQRIREGGALALDEVIRIGSQVAEALLFAHRHEPRVVHRDIKPANILIEGRTGRAVVTDFGIAKILEPQESLRTRTGEVFGTFKYCAPEQLRGASDVDARADIYSLGMVLYEMATGRQWFAGKDEGQILSAALQDDASYELPADVPTVLCRIITRAIEKDRTRRYQDVSEMLDDLRAAAREGGMDLNASVEVELDAEPIGVDLGEAPAIPSSIPPATSPPTIPAEEPPTIPRDEESQNVIRVERPARTVALVMLAIGGITAVMILGWLAVMRSQY